MHTIKRLFFFVLVFTLALHTAVSQEEELPDKLAASFENYLDRREIKDIQEKLTETWQSGWYTPEMKVIASGLFDKLVAFKARPVPDLKYFAELLIMFVDGEAGRNNAEVWFKYVSQQLDNPEFKRRELDNIIQNLYALVKNKSLFESNSIEWKISGNYQFNIEDNRLIVNVPQSDLTCYASRDSIKIYNTSGKCDFLANTWTGAGGNVYWKRCDLDIDMVNTELLNYTIDLTKNEYESDSVNFIHKRYFKTKITGSFKDRAMYVRNPSSARYPRFQSHANKFEFNNIYPGIDYMGGFSLEGPEIIGSGTPDEPATIQMKNQDTVRLIARGTYFIIREDRITGQNVAIDLLLSKERIIHPGLMFRYTFDDQTLNLIRQGSNYSASPFVDYFHDITIDAEMCAWNRNSNKILFNSITGSAINKVNLRSLNYYNPYEMAQWQGFDAVHPFYGMYNFEIQMGYNGFPVEDYARYMNKPAHQIRKQIIKFVELGFIEYNPENDFVVLTDRLYNYIEFDKGNMDYDIIKFESSPVGNVDCCILDLNTEKLQVNGVNGVYVRSKQNIGLIPTGKSINIAENLNFSFDGVLATDLFIFHGKDYRFEYDSFKIAMANIDSLVFRTADSTDEYGRLHRGYIQSVISDVSGEFFLDDPNNKSGKENFEEYPKFKSNQKSYVFYDQPFVQNGDYKRKDFYFEIDPYVIDSLNNKRQRRIEFSGRLVSGIFPPIEEKLRVMEDNSFGFKTKTNKNGIDLYQKAIFYQDIELSNQGLRGSGKIEYMKSSITSREILFLPQELICKADTFKNEPDYERDIWSEVFAQNAHIKWRTSNNVLELNTINIPVLMYDSLASLTGTLTLLPENLLASGKFKMKGLVDLNSKVIELMPTRVVAVESDVYLAEGDIHLPLASTSIDLEAKRGRVETTYFTPVEFIKNKMYTSDVNINWNLDGGNYQVTSNDSSKINHTLVSIHKNKDSLDISSKLTIYNPETGDLLLNEVEQIEVADAVILPSTKQVVVNNKGNTEPLDSALIQIVYQDNTHTIENATVNINSKNSFKANGFYSFKDGFDNDFIINLDSIFTENGLTRARGNINDMDFFYLHPQFFYAGAVELQGGQEFLFYDGYVKLINECPKGPSQEIKFASYIDPENVIIPIGEELNNTRDERLYTGFYLYHLETTSFYAAFADYRQDYSDIPLLTTRGELYYDNIKKAYVISPEKSENYDDQTGAIWFVNDKCEIYGYGQFDPGLNFGRVKMKTGGLAAYNTEKQSADFSVIMAVDFFMNKKAVNLMGESLKISKLERSNAGQANFANKLKIFTGEETAYKTQVEVSQTGKVDELPEILQSSICFTDVNLWWNKFSRSYMSYGDLGIGFMNGETVNKKATGKIELVKRHSGDILQIYIEVDKNNWYFFSYRNGVMETRSGDDIYNSIIEEEKDDDRELKVGGPEEAPYRYILAPLSKVNQFRTDVSNLRE